MVKYLILLVMVVVVVAYAATQQEYINQIKTEIDQKKYTPTQVKAFTEQQIANKLGVAIDDPRWSDGSEQYYINLKRKLVEYAAYKQELRDIATIRAGIKTFFDTNFPKYEAERGPGPYPSITIYYRGRDPNDL